MSSIGHFASSPPHTNVDDSYRNALCSPRLSFGGARKKKEISLDTTLHFFITPRFPLDSFDEQSMLVGI